MDNIQINDIKELMTHIHLLPKEVAADVKKRVTDWIGSGGSFSDDYIIRQCRYAEEVLNSMKQEKTSK